jgi:hypothetical protein
MVDINGSAPSTSEEKPSSASGEPFWLSVAQMLPYSCGLIGMPGQARTVWVEPSWTSPAAWARIAAYSDPTKLS